MHFLPKGIIWTNVVEVHEVILHTKYQGSRPCGYRQEFFMFSLYKPMLNLWPLGADPFLAIFWKSYFILGVGGILGSRGIVWINLVKGPWGDATYQRPCGFRQEDFFMFLFSLCKPCDPWGRAIIDPRGIIWTNLVEVNHTKYQSSRLWLWFQTRRFFHVFPK